MSDDEDDDYTREVIEHDLDMRTLRTLQQWAKDCVMRYDAVGIPSGRNLMTVMVRVLVGTLVRAKMPKADFLALMDSAYDHMAQDLSETRERRHAEDR